MMHPFSSTSSTRPLIIGHRGALACAPENTLAAFRTGLAQGADGVECDVHLSRDGQVVIHHDFTLERTTGGHGPVAACSAAELAALDAGSWFAPRFAGEPVPTLAQLCALVVAASREQARPLRLVVELKAGSRRYPGIEREVLATLAAHELLPQSALISFDHPALVVARQLEPGVATGILYYAVPVDAPAFARMANATALGPARELVSQEEVEVAHAAGLPVFVWTAETPAQVRALAALGVDAMGANHPAEALAALA